MMSLNVNSVFLDIPQIKIISEVSSLIDLIRTHQYQLYKKEILKYDFDNMNVFKQTNLLVELLIEIEDSSLFEFTLNYFQDLDNTSDVNIFTRLLSINSCPMDVLFKVSKTFDDIEPSEILNFAVQSQITEELFSNILNRLSVIYPSKVNNFYLFDSLAKKLENIPDKEDILEYVLSLKNMQIVANSSKEWVNVREGETISLLNYDLWRQIDNEETEDLTIDDILKDFEPVDEKISSQIEQIMNTPYYYDLKNVSQYNKYPTDPTRMFGPVNKKKDNCISGVIKGKCRMLTCMCKEDNDDFDINDPNPDPDSWFTGYCDMCEKKILNISHSLRWPVIGGGWIGCMCSRECLEDYSKFNSIEYPTMLVNDMMNLIMEKGIVDREKLL